MFFVNSFYWTGALGTGSGLTAGVSLGLGSGGVSLGLGSGDVSLALGSGGVSSGLGLGGVSLGLSLGGGSLALGSGGISISQKPLPLAGFRVYPRSYQRLSLGYQ